MSDPIINNPAVRHDFVLLFDVTDGNPNGDPDAGNMPRVDPETMQGLVTDVCIKRKVRNFVTLAAGGRPGYGIYVNDAGVALNQLHEDAYEAEGLTSTGTKQRREDVDKARARMCQEFYDVRMFGAVMTTGVNCGQVRGPLQLTFARSLSPVVPLDVSITRVAITKKEDIGMVEGKEDRGDAVKGSKVTEMGRKPLLPYGLYRAHGFFSAPFAGKTGVRSEDLALFWEALQGMWDHDRSASRGMMGCRGLWIFSHDCALGKASAQSLFDRIKIRPKSEERPARSFTDYQPEFSAEPLPPGVALTCLVNAWQGMEG